MATIRKRNSKWQVQVRSNGQTASRTFSQRVDAVKWGREAERSAELGLLHQPSASSVEAMTFGQVLERYRDEVTSAKRCVDNETYAINGFLRSCSKLAGKLIGKLTSADFIAHRDKRSQKMKPATVVRELGWMQHAVDIACSDWGQRVRDGNPVKQVRRPRINNRRERRLQVGEWQALFDAVNEDRLPMMKPLLALALATGMRRGELLSLQWKHVDLERCTAFLPQTKNGRARTVPLSPTAVRVLEQLSQTSERCVPLSGNSVGLAFDRLRQRAKVVDLTVHDIRHEAVSRFVESGLSLAQVQMISGHRDLRMLMRYTHLQTDDIVAKLHAVECEVVA